MMRGFVLLLTMISSPVLSFTTNLNHPLTMATTRFIDRRITRSTQLYVSTPGELQSGPIENVVDSAKDEENSSATTIATTTTTENDNDDQDKDEIDDNDEDTIIQRPSNNFRSIKAVAPKTCALNQAVSAIADVSLEEASELIAIGAVWARMETLTTEDMLTQYGSGEGAGFAATSVKYADMPRKYGGSSSSSSAYGSTHSEYETNGKAEPGEDLDAYIEQMTSQRYRRILTPSIVEGGTDIRIYPEPRRFPSCYEINKDRLLYQDTTFIVVDKPPMLPTQPDTSNYFECCPGCTNDLLGPFHDIDGNLISRPQLCHRVDSCVGGCVVMSKDQNGQRVFNELQRNRKLKKVYLAVTNKPVPVGRHICWMWKPANVRGSTGGPPCQLVSFTPPASRRKSKTYWIRCVLEVVKCEPIQIQKNDDHTYDPGDKDHFQSTIRLVTGRKHQVRAQLASLGAPIIRDTLYQPIAGYTLDNVMGSIDIDNDGDNDVDDEEVEAGMDEAVSKCKVPTEPIGLQAHAILFGGIRAKARTPWWGDGVIRRL